MAPNISENLSHLSQSAKEINRLADRATEQIRALESHLQQTQLGIAVCLSSRKFAQGREINRHNFRVSANYFLGYGRTDNGTFGISVEACCEATDKNGNTLKDAGGEAQYETAWIHPLDQVNRELRIAAIPRLPELIEELSKKADETVELLRGSVVATQAIVDELKAAIPQNQKK